MIFVPHPWFPIACHECVFIPGFVQEQVMIIGISSVLKELLPLFLVLPLCCSQFLGAQWLLELANVINSIKLIIAFQFRCMILVYNLFRAHYNSVFLTQKPVRADQGI